MSYDLATTTNPSGALTDFSLIIDLSTMSASWWAANDSADGTKGRAFKGDGVTELATDWIDFNNSGETGWLRVKYSGTLASSGVQKICIYPPLAANASYAAGDTYGSDNAYRSIWDGYWYDGGTDRTSYGVDGSAQGGVSIGGAATTKVGKATDFDGADDFASIADSDQHSLDAGGNTWMFWANIPASLSGARAIFAKYADVDPFTAEWLISIRETKSLGSGSRGVFAQLLDDATEARKRWESQDSLLPLNAWAHIAIVWDGTLGATGGVAIYINGSSVALDEVELNFDAIVNRGGITTIGAGAIATAGDQNFDTYWNSEACEFIKLDSDVSAAWIAEEYAQTNDQATFWGTWTWTSVVPLLRHRRQMAMR